jgi:release factor glutamine methyltransferase
MAETGPGLAEAAALLARVSDTPRLDAELLLAHALGISRERLLLDPPARTPRAFAELVDRRLAHEPVAYITGQRAFWTLDLAVGPGVLVPRPDSETLIEAAIAHFGDRAPASVLDLGTGSGALLLAALDHWRGAWGVGVDRSAEALGIARANAAPFGPRAVFVRGDWAAALDARFDLVLCNPPYVETNADLPRDVAEWEPASALFAGPEGLDDYRRLAPELDRLLAPGGAAILEIGASQRGVVSALVTAAGLVARCRQDLGGRDRCLVVTRD